MIKIMNPSDSIKLKYPLKDIKMKKDTTYLTNGKITISKEESYYNKKRVNIIKRVPLKILDNNIWKPVDVFTQNNSILSKRLREYVFDNIEDNLYGIGGEFYVYGIKYNKYYKGISNNKEIIETAKFNNNLYLLNSELKEVDYNKGDFLEIEDKSTILINLSKININIINFCNKNKKLITKIILISCNEKDYYKKINKFNFNIKAITNFYDKKVIKVTILI